MNTKGTLAVVGTGIGLAGQITVISQSYIENADVVFGVLPDAASDQWIASLNSNYVSLQPLYDDGKSRLETYQQMVETLLQAVREGKQVVGAFYGHAGVFAWAPHEAVRRAKAEGFQAHMEPGVSAEDCLIADLGLDPGATGCQAFEATQFLFYHHTLDPASMTILWQIGLAGEHTIKRFDTTEGKLRVATEMLAEHFPLDHEVILYEAPFLPTETARMDRITLRDLPKARLSMITTMVIPPVQPLTINHEALAKFGLTREELGF